MLLYRVIITLLWGPAALGLLLQVLRGRERFGDWLERLGLRMGKTSGPHIWIHAASNGELASAKPLILALQTERPDLGLLITTNSVSGRTLARKWALPGLHAQLAPIDTFWATWRLKKRFSVKGLLIVESEFWLNRIALNHTSGNPVFVIGARLSEKTARGWARFGILVGALRMRLSHLSPQDRKSRQRFLALGVPADRVGPVLDLKALYTPPEDMTPTDSLAQAFDREATWLAASTHAGEDEVVLAAHKALQNDWPELQLILAPRHPKRADGIADLIQKAGLPLARRSKGEAPREGAVFLADTLGEMPLWYQLAGTSFIGGSLVEKGGHTPFEPAAFDSTILHGPEVSNFRKVYRQLDVSGAAIQVSDPETLRNAVLMARDPERRDTMRRIARDTLRQPNEVATEVARFFAALGA